MANMAANHWGKRQQNKLWQSVWEGIRELDADAQGGRAAPRADLPVTRLTGSSPLMRNLGGHEARMRIDICLASDSEEARQRKDPPLLSLEFDAYYWFLHRYFEHAKLDRSRELIDPLAGAVLEGYQLDRIEDELRVALVDITRRPSDTWDVLLGWNSPDIGRDTEVRRPVEKGRLVELIHKLLGLIMRARDANRRLVLSVSSLPQGATRAQI